MSKLEYREFSDYPLEEFFDRLIELIQIDRDDIISKRVYNKEWKAIKKRVIYNEALRREVERAYKFYCCSPSGDGSSAGVLYQIITNVKSPTKVTDGISKEKA